MKNIFGRVRRDEIASVEAFEQKNDALAQLTNHQPRKRDIPGSRVILPESAILGLAYELPTPETLCVFVPETSPLEPVIFSQRPGSPNDQVHRSAS